MRQLAASIAMMCAGSLAAHGQPNAEPGQAPAPYAGHALVQARIETRAQMERMLAISGDCWACEPRPGLVPFRVAPEDMDRLRASGIEFEVLIEDLQQVVDAERDRIRAARAAGPDDDWYAEYKDLSEVYTRLGEFAAAKPDLVSEFLVGTSIEGREIRGILIAEARDAGEPCRPTLFLNGTQHAREWINTMTTMYHAQRFVMDYGTDPEITDLLGKIDVVVVPVVNPDGFEYTWTSQRFWRKNRRDNGDGTFGVDLNRNWGFMWGLTVPGSSAGSSRTSSEVYWGTGPFSEPETAQTRDLVESMPQIRGSNDIHSYGELILHPWSHSPDPSPDDATFQLLGRDMRLAVRDVHGHSYAMGRSYSTLYPHVGTATDWFYGERGIIAYSYELRGPTFAPPAEEILPCAEEAFAGTLAHARYIADRYGFISDWDRDCVHTLFDFLGYLNDFGAGDLKADLNGDGVLDVFDFFEYQTLFETEQ
ncbi:MAG: M14 family zinc carboxypeptidase [Phycisphaerales bacterium JB039]